MMTEIKDRVKEQLEQFNSNIEQVVSASRGLYIKLKEEGNKQFNDFVSAGEAQKAAEAEGANTVIAQLTNDVKDQFGDVKGSIKQIKKASLGLIVKAKESSDKVFGELVELGQKEEVAE